MPVSIEHVRADLIATDRDIVRLKAIVTNINGFMADNHGEKRWEHRKDALKYNELLGQAEKLRAGLLKALEQMEQLQ